MPTFAYVACHLLVTGTGIKVENVTNVKNYSDYLGTEKGKGQGISEGEIKDTKT